MILVRCGRIWCWGSALTDCAYYLYLQLECIVFWCPTSLGSFFFDQITSIRLKEIYDWIISMQRYMYTCTCIVVTTTCQWWMCLPSAVWTRPSISYRLWQHTTKVSEALCPLLTKPLACIASYLSFLLHQRSLSEPSWYSLVPTWLNIVSSLQTNLALDQATPLLMWFSLLVTYGRKLWIVVM